MCLHTFILSVFLSAPFCFCPHPFISVHTLFSACTLFHFTHHDFSFRKVHIKSDFLSIHHVCLHTFILSSYPRPFVSVRALLFLSTPFGFFPSPFVSVCALFSVCTLFHFTYHDFSFRKGHIKSDFLSIHHVCLHTFILSSCLCPFASVHALLFLSAPFCFGLHPFVSVSALFSVCTLFHFTYHDFSFRKGPLSQIF